MLLASAFGESDAPSSAVQRAPRCAPAVAPACHEEATTAPARPTLITKPQMAAEAPAEPYVDVAAVEQRGAPTVEVEHDAIRRTLAAALARWRVAVDRAPIDVAALPSQLVAWEARLPAGGKDAGEAPSQRSRLRGGPGWPHLARRSRRSWANRRPGARR